MCRRHWATIYLLYDRAIPASVATGTEAVTNRSKLRRTSKKQQQQEGTNICELHNNATTNGIGSPDLGLHADTGSL